MRRTFLSFNLRPKPCFGPKRNLPQGNVMKKAATGIRGFDDISLGGLPAGRITLVEGCAGAGKTVFALECVVHAVRTLDEPAIFVCFEEDPARLRENAQSFDWNLESIPETQLLFIEAQPDLDLITSGDFDISGLLAILQVKVVQLGIRRIVFDAIDLLFTQMDAAIAHRELRRLKQWLSDLALTAILTSKISDNELPAVRLPSMETLPFMVDCAIMLNHDHADGISQRSLRITKYRGSAFQENAFPFVIGVGGIDVAFVYSSSRNAVPPSSERLSTGLPELDTMLRGGIFRGASILVTGYPGTAKTTLCGAFLAAACQRGEKALFVSFVSRDDEIIANLQSVSIDLQPHLESGLLRMLSARALRGSAETHLLAIRTHAREHGATCIAIDPLSALSKSGTRGTAPGVSERLIDWAKAEGITVLCTSLLDDAELQDEATPLQISTIADTWFHLSYEVSAGERNRRLSIVKARGTGNSNQVREFVLSDAGVSFKDVFMADGDVLVGSQRRARERDDRQNADQLEADGAREGDRLAGLARTIEGRISELEDQLKEKRKEAAAFIEKTAKLAGDAELARTTPREPRND